MSKKKKTQVGGKINRPGQLAPPPLQSSIGNITAKKTAQLT